MTPVPEATATPDGAASSSAPAASPASAAAAAGELDKILATLKGPDQRKLLILDEILKSRNDNDPRLDTELKVLSPELKRAMTRYYQTIPDERRNERGTIAFLYARGMTRPEEMEFITSILMEKPCLSLSDCSKPDGAHDPEAEHLQGISETTANYPQLTALRQALDKYNATRGENPPNTALADAIVEGYRKVLSSAPNDRIRQEAERVLRYLGKL